MGTGTGLLNGQCTAVTSSSWLVNVQKASGLERGLGAVRSALEGRAPSQGVCRAPSQDQPSKVLLETPTFLNLI